MSMALDAFLSLQIIETLENYINRIRPSEEIRDKLDIIYKTIDQSVIIYEIRPNWKNPNSKIESPIAKITFVKSQKQWKIFWVKSDLKWHVYKPKPEVKTIQEFVEIVEEDKHHCFWG